MQRSASFTLFTVAMAMAIMLALAASMVSAAPQGPAEKPEPYEYHYEVKDAEKQLFFDKNEMGDASGKVTGKYSVWLPDGRLMTVEYNVEKETGFVPKITFAENANPLG